MRELSEAERCERLPGRTCVSQQSDGSTPCGVVPLPLGYKLDLKLK